MKAKDAECAIVTLLVLALKLHTFKSRRTILPPIGGFLVFYGFILLSITNSMLWLFVPAVKFPPPITFSERAAKPDEP